MCNSRVDFFFCVFYNNKRRCLIPVAEGKCICPRLNEFSYCLLISLSLSPSFTTPWHLQSFTCILFFCPSPLTPTVQSFSPSPAAEHASRQWDIAFLILLTGDNIYVLFFDIHFSCSHRPQSGLDTKAQLKHSISLPLLMLVCFFLFVCVLTTFSPLSPPPKTIFIFILIILRG